VSAHAGVHLPSRTLAALIALGVCNHVTLSGARVAGTRRGREPSLAAARMQQRVPPYEKSASRGFCSLSIAV